MEEYDDFPTAADEPVYEELPDYTLATEETPVYETGGNALSVAPDDTLLFEESTLDAEMLTELEAFIARAKARKKGIHLPPQKAKELKRKPKVKTSLENNAVDPINHQVNGHAGTTRKPNSPGPSFEFGFGPEATPPPTTNREATPDIPFEVVTGGEEALTNDRLEVPSTQYGQDDAPPKTPQGNTPPAPATGTFACPNCSTKLPPSARFCYNCGTPQPTLEDRDAAQLRGDEDQTDSLAELPELPADDPRELKTSWSVPDAIQPENASNQSTDKPAESANPSYGQAPKISNPVYTLAGLKQAFRDELIERVTRYFGERSLAKYLAKLQADYEFQQVRDNSLSNLIHWQSENPHDPLLAWKISNVQADLAEYFLVETARDLHRNIFPQRLLRYQSVNWSTVDIFQLVMDYLDFSKESDLIYTDFITMPKRALKNATQSFLQAAKDERILFICDQSLVSQAKNGFAMTDTGIYWKNIFQPPGCAAYHSMAAPRVEGGHVVLDAQYFDAGSSLNLKIALLLDKLRRIKVD